MYPVCVIPYISIFFFNDTATTEIYTLSLHDALPISLCRPTRGPPGPGPLDRRRPDRQPDADPDDGGRGRSEEHTSNSSHMSISYAVFCLKKKKNNKIDTLTIPYQRTAYMMSSLYTLR